MAQGDTPITLVGNLVADPELRYTPSGAAVANFRVASTPRRFDSQSNQWVDGEALFLACNIWRQAAENVANSLTKGDRVIVQGRLRQRSYDTREGEKRTVYEIEVDEVGPSLRYATSQVTKTPRQGGQGNWNGGNQGGNQGNQGGYSGGNQGGQGNQGNQGGFGGNQNRSAAPQQGDQGGFGGRNASNDDDPWSSAPQSSGFDGGDEPPF
ncbi:single-stranded DNA-binding protein [Corynebacterium variabile]|uniref:single-stranded DNA-binding protein n=1 Tax=Corynebacterium variabile TaxID=1727 RepID=UPI00264A3F12|nr:single-stranded DNA-binding protein [Corynebacterium variabile]MDN6242018.1 single-stranded DNA-binding protein [Corynebacterium variabile]MDN6476629.1 single-stranded DNA-binding protein [Corynebacterium variabile]MDN6618128.1 single-stranded DNA-binding protein [Corynebacterium variabile]MDN6845594.1 single-stranded DNA-binding protein [Corynebacterium variabile]